MKMAVFLLVLLLLVPFSVAKTQTMTLDRGESAVIENINVTLVDYIKKDKKILICVNDEKTIISDDKRVNGVYLEIVSFREDGVKFELQADCDDCVPSDNAKCFLKKNDNINLIEDESENETIDSENETDGINNLGNESENSENTVEKKEYKGILHRVISWISSFFS